jgi:hypothetical protein
MRLCTYALAVSNPQPCERSLVDRVLPKIRYLGRVAKQHVCSSTAVPLHISVQLVTGQAVIGMS